MISKENAEKIYEILVADAGARPDDMQEFVHHHAESKHPCFEWRFQGHLGFGGKFYSSDMWRIGCYREDDTPERNAIIAKVNQKLANLQYNPHR